jgi:SAM-dependent methyltransferase
MPESRPRPQDVGDYYDQWTSRYQESFGDTFQAYRPAEITDLHRYILESSGVRDGERILDAGCGIGGPSRYFASHRDISIAAVTISPAQAVEGRRLNAEAGLDERIATYLADFHRLHELFPPASFDRVLFLESMSHASDALGPLQSAFRVLKPGGTVYIKDFFQKACADPVMQRRVKDVIARVDREFRVATPLLDRLVGALGEAGFARDYVRPLGFDNDLAVWLKFNTAHDFELYGGQEPVQWCDWMELRFHKPPGAEIA